MRTHFQNSHLFASTSIVKPIYLDVARPFFSLKYLGYLHQGPGQQGQVIVFCPSRQEVRVPCFLSIKTPTVIISWRPNDLTP